MDKKAITAEIIKELNLDITLEKALRVYWWPDTNRTNLRLTKAGLRMMSKVMKPYEFAYEIRPTGNALKQLQKVQSPFFIDFQGTVTVFGEQLASLIILYGSFDKYMESLTKNPCDT